MICFKYSCYVFDASKGHFAGRQRVVNKVNNILNVALWESVKKDCKYFGMGYGWFHKMFETRNEFQGILTLYQKLKRQKVSWFFVPLVDVVKRMTSPRQFSFGHCQVKSGRQFASNFMQINQSER